MGARAVDILRIGLEDARYPSQLEGMPGYELPTSLDALGNLDLLSRRKLAVLCSVKCPGSLILQSYDLMQRLRQADLAVVGGFHSPMEREWLAALADELLVAHASPGGKTEQFCRELLEWGKPLYTLEDRANGNLFEMGARPLRLAPGVPLPWS